MDEPHPTPEQLMLRRALEVASIGVAIVRLDGAFADVNPAMAEMLGVSREEVLTRRARDFAYDEDVDRLREMAGDAFAGSRRSVDARLVRGDGSLLWASVTLVLVFDEAGDPSHLVVEASDISERHAAVELLQSERDQSAALLAALREGYVFTVGDVVREVNDAVCALTGFSRDELLGSAPPYPVWPPEHVEQLTVLGRELVASGGAGEATWTRKDGSRFEVSLSATPVLAGNGETRGVITLVSDISARKAKERRLRHRADHDGLTDLLNQAASHRALRGEVAAANAHGLGLSIAVLDIDRFKDVNDTHGHGVGDLVLAEFARRLRDHARAKDRLGRIGGEEFLWVMPETTLAEALTAVERVAARFRGDPFTLVGPVTFSAGVADLCHDELSEDMLLRADSQLYVAKRLGRDRVHSLPSPRAPVLFG